MKTSLNWLREFVDFPGDAPALAELLTMAGVEVEGVETRGVAIANVVVAQILESQQHPNADRLSVCKVDDGSGCARQIVCGAKNYKVGDKVPLALPGAVLPGDFKIKVGKLRGVESEGMMCSEKELGIAEDAAGLLILPPESRVGAPIDELFPPDTVLDLEITPNRPDLLSHIGIAREVAALAGVDFKFQNSDLKSPASADATVTIDARVQCPFYSARRIANVKVGPSPEWLRRKLEAVGLRPINNVVDITNLVMLEMGQPLHAFDAAKVEGGIRVRLAAEGEEFLALDGRTYKLRAADLMIADQRKAIAIAGVMGGEDTGVTEATRDVIIESAYFQPASIRRTSRDLGLMSDSSYRFERGVDPEGVLRASQRATELIVELCGSQAAPEASVAGEVPNLRRTVTLRPERCRRVIGVEVSAARLDEILSRFGLQKREGHAWDVPSFRGYDLTREADLIEEIARVVGIGNVPARHAGCFGAASASDRIHDRNMALRQTLVGMGFAEARTGSLISEKMLADHVFAAVEVRRVRNPLSEDQVVLRPSLSPGLLGVVERNVRGGAKTLRLFELGRTFRASGGDEEETHLGLVLSGSVAERSWREAKPRETDFFDLKGVLAALSLGELTLRAAANAALAVPVEILLGDTPIGHAGQLWPARARALDVTAPLLIAEINLSALAIPEPSSRRRCRELPRFPAVTRDIAIIAPTDITHAQILDTIRAANEPLLTSLELFDVFSDPTGQRVPAGLRSLAYSLTFRTADRTLLADEVNAAHARIKDRLKAALSVQFRE